jgi:AraC-like DNA-binding protein
MSTFRQAAPDTVLMRTLALDLPPGMLLDKHAHAWLQLVFAERGALTVSVADRLWMVPPCRALWVPADTAHRVETLGAVSLRTLYLSLPAADVPGDGFCALDVSPLLRQLVLEAVRRGPLWQGIGMHRHLAGLVVHQLTAATRLRLDLPLPRDARARRLADRVRRELGGAQTLAELADGSGASPRTLERLFLAETGLSFGQWRQQARLQHALRRLAESVDVATVEGECGYESVSAFVSRFRLAIGVTPGQFRTRGNLRGVR